MGDWCPFFFPHVLISKFRIITIIHSWVDFSLGSLPSLESDLANLLSSLIPSSQFELTQLLT
jgi:hypothetical protein